MANLSVAPPGGPARWQLLLTAYGVLAFPLPASSSYGTGQLLTSQSLFGNLVGLRAGDIVTGFAIQLRVAAAGTVPTSLLAVIQDSTGKVLYTVETKSNAAWTGAIGWQYLNFGASYTILTNGGYYVSLWQNGAFGTTPPQIGRTSGASVTHVQGINGGPPWAITPTALASVSVNDTPALTVATDVYGIAPYGTAVTP